MVKPDPKSQIDYPDVNLKSLILFKPLYFIIEGPFTLSVNQLGLQATHFWSESLGSLIKKP